MKDDIIEEIKRDAELMRLCVEAKAERDRRAKARRFDGADLFAALIVGFMFGVLFISLFK